MTFEQSEAMLRNTKLHASDIIEAHHIKKSLEMLDYLNEDLYEISHQYLKKFIDKAHIVNDQDQIRFDTVLKNIKNLT